MVARVTPSQGLLDRERAMSIRAVSAPRVWTFSLIMVCIAAGLWVFGWMYGPDRSELVEVILPALRWMVALPAFVFLLRTMLEPRPGFVAQAAFIAVLGVLLVFDRQPYESLLLWARMLISFMLARCAVFLTIRQRVRVVDTIILAIAFVTIGSFLLWAAGVETTFEVGGGYARRRMQGLAASPANLGYGGAFLFTWAGLRATRKGVAWWVRAGWAALALVGWQTIVLADSRSGYLAALGATIVVLVYPRLMARLRRPGQAMAVALAGFLGMLMLYSIPLLYATRVLDLSTNEDLSSLARIALWQTGLGDFLDHPLTGVGLSNKYDISVAFNIKTFDLYYYHSAMLNYFAKGGIFAGLVFAWLVYASIRAVVWSLFSITRAPFVARVAPEAYEDAKKLADFGLIAVLITLLFSVIEAPLQGGMFQTFFLFFFAVSALPVSYGARVAPPPRVISR